MNDHILYIVIQFLIIPLITLIFRYYRLRNIDWKNSIEKKISTLENKIDDNYQQIGIFNAHINTIMNAVEKFNTNIIVFEKHTIEFQYDLKEIKNKLLNIDSKVNTLEDEVSNNIRGKLYKIVVSGTRGFNPQLEPEKVFLAYLLDKNINEVTIAIGKIIKNIELINDTNFKVALLGRTKSCLLSSYIGVDINNNLCNYPLKLINDIVEIQNYSYNTFVENLKLALSLKKDNNLKELILINLYREFEDYIDKMCITFEKHSRDIKDVNYLKERYPNSANLLKSKNINLELKKEEIDKNTLLLFLTKGITGIKDVLNLLNNTKELPEDVTNNLIVLSNNFNRLISDKSIGLDIKENELNRIVLTLSNIIEENINE